ncbi:hypothetical protein PF011_g15346 [Phytophthora fragariae]|uniref:PH domain-containing protein n=1 Tax=Phytophthora fragariae TaxID=53985 RepID=A0A6A3K161_9STRA|nr:hypothetical protein PF011_g15346 [Phytophthora fragariae]
MTLVSINRGVTTGSKHFKKAQENTEKTYGEMALTPATPSVFAEPFFATLQSMGSGSTSSSSNVAFLPAAAVAAEDGGDEGYAAERNTTRTASRRNNTSLLFSSSICLSRGVGDHTHNLLFSNTTGELQMRRDVLFHMLRLWSRCSLHLSVLTGELRVHRKSRAEPQVFPLTMYTGASIHRKHPNVFKIFFYGHDALLFRSAEPRDAALWVQALDYTKEFTWHLWP